MDADGNGTGNLVPAVRLLLRTVAHRLALAALEVEEARTRVLGSALWLCVATMACVVTGVAATLLVAAIFWDTAHRITALIVLSALYAVGALFTVQRLRRGWKEWRPFAVTSTALQEDLRWLRRLIDE